MRLPENNNLSHQSAGEEFVKKIGLLGAILFLLLSIIGTILMVVAGRMEPSESEKLPEETNVPPPSVYSSLYSLPHQLF